MNPVKLRNWQVETDRTNEWSRFFDWVTFLLTHNLRQCKLSIFYSRNFPLLAAKKETTCNMFVYFEMYETQFKA